MSQGAGAGEAVLGRAPWRGFAEASEYAQWVAAAEAAAAELLTDVVERDQLAGRPAEEVEILQRHGLLNLLVPAEHGGIGGHWSTAAAAVRAIGTADGSAAQLLANHYLNQACIGLVADPERQGEWYAKSAAGTWFWAAATNPGDPPVRLTRDGDGLQLDGRKRYATGVAQADVLIVAAEDVAGVLPGSEPGKRILIAVETSRGGFIVENDWDRIGQRRTGSSSVTLEGVPVTAADVLGDPGRDWFAALTAPLVQLLFANLDAGLGRGALTQVASLVSARTRPLAGGEVGASSDPLLHRLLGELDAHLAAAEALLDRIGADFEVALDRFCTPGAPAVTEADRHALTIAAARAKVVAVDAALDAASRGYEALGASGTERSLGLDRFWRDLRTHSLHDSLEHKRREIGAALLGAAAHEPTLYR